MGVTIKNIISLFFTLIIQLSIIAQDSGKEHVIEKIDGVKYYIHHVEKGHTLYAISKKYAVETGLIIEANPEAKSGLKIGQVLKIPVSGVNKKEARQNTPEVEGEYLIHTVEKGETLYSLSRTYSIDIHDILRANNDAIDGLNIGDKLKIPSGKIIREDLEDLAPAEEDSLVTHLVKKGETLYSISKSYEVDIDSLRMLNNDFPGGLKENTLVRIPRVREGYRKEDRLAKIYRDSLFYLDTVVIKEIYHVALMLPFYVDMNDTLESKRKLNEDEMIYSPSEIALKFYEGALIAIDSIKKSGLSVKLYVYDTRNDTNEIKKILQKPEMTGMNLFIGPLFRSNLELVLKFAKPRGINVVCPVPQSNKLLLGNQRVSKVSASLSVQMEQMAVRIAREYSGKNILLFYSSEPEDIRLASLFRSRYYDSLSNDSLVDSLQLVTRQKLDTNSIKVLLDDSATNVVIVPSDNQVYVSDLITKLNTLAESHKIIVYGTEKWKSYHNIDVQYLHNLNIHIPSSMHVDYEAPQTREFMKEFRKRYYSDPGKYGFMGFDVCYYYLSALKRYGIRFHEHLPEMKQNGHAVSFDFFKTGLENGYENKHVYILKYEDFKLVQVNDNAYPANHH